MSEDTNHSEANEPVEELSARRRSLAGEFWDYLKYNKKWWLTPIILIMLLFAVLLIFAGMGGGAVAPFIYTIF